MDKAQALCTAINNYFDTEVKRKRIDFRGVSPEYGIACRVCWDIIKGGDRAVDTGYAAFHESCYTEMSTLYEALHA